VTPLLTQARDGCQRIAHFAESGAIGKAGLAAHGERMMLSTGVRRDCNQASPQELGQEFDAVRLGLAYSFR
jgi:hypothetical protein